MSAPMAITLDAKADWMTDAELVLLGLCVQSRRAGSTFTADDFDERMKQMGMTPEDSRWPGLAFTAARTRGDIERTGEYIRSKRRGRKGSVLAVWRAAW